MGCHGLHAEGFIKVTSLHCLGGREEDDIERCSGGMGFTPYGGVSGGGRNVDHSGLPHESPYHPIRFEMGWSGCRVQVV